MLCGLGRAEHSTLAGVLIVEHHGERGPGGLQWLARRACRHLRLRRCHRLLRIMNVWVENEAKPVDVKVAFIRQLVKVGAVCPTQTPAIHEVLAYLLRTIVRGNYTGYYAIHHATGLERHRLLYP